MNRKQHDVIMYLHAENEILKEQLDKKGVKLKLSNAQRYKLAKKGKKLGRQGLMQYASIVTPDTILAWHRKLVAMKYTAKRMMKTGRQKRMEVIRGLCVQFAEENMSWGYGRIQGEGFNFRNCSPCQRLMEIRKKRLEDALKYIFSHNGGLVEPQAA
jgi:hypothetical protein